jgi:ATP-dependent RNA helicase SUPV3L1/SUV3
LAGLLAADEFVESLALASSARAAAVAGISPHRFGQLALAGIVRPVVSYTNQYHVQAWLYSVADARALPQQYPELTGARLPERLRTALAGGVDRRAEQLRGRLRSQAVLGLRDPWTRAAAWLQWLRFPAQPDGGPADAPEAVPDTGRSRPLTSAELVHLARRTAEHRLGDVLSARTAIVTAKERGEVHREFLAALRRARRGRGAPGLVAPEDAARRLGCPVERLPAEYRALGVPADLVDECLTAGRRRVPPPSRLAGQRRREAVARGRTARAEVRRAEAERRTAARRAEQEARARAGTRIPSRTGHPRFTLHLGPTNSGKTHGVLARLADCAADGRRGVYAAPLRMLAAEAYERLRERIGAEAVGLRTGEEHINPQAPVLCCTAEAAPATDGLLIVDEAHWLADPARGHAWTRLLLTGAHDEVHVVAAPEAEPLLRRLLPVAASITVVRHRRVTRLALGEPYNARSLPSGSALVAFSRKAVLALHRELIEAGRSATVLYGAMPPAARREQIRRLSDGEVDVIVTTDVIGHGVNLPLRTVAFAETSKYDGRTRRPLYRWEAAQIAGRAGRRGQGAGDGTAALYRSRLPALVASGRLVARAAQTANGLAPADLSLAAAPLSPVWADLGEPAPGEIPFALAGWATAARIAARTSTWLAPMPIDTLQERLRTAADCTGVPRTVDAAWPVDGRTLWRLATLAVDPDRPAFRLICRAVVDSVSLRGILRSAQAVAGMTLEAAEEYAGLVRDLRTAALAFGGKCGGVEEQEAAAAEQAAAARIVALVSSGRPLASHGACADCGGPCAPWLSYCDACYAPWGRWDGDDSEN